MPLSRLACICEMFFANEESLSPEEFLIETTKHHLVAAGRSGSQFCWVTRPSITGHSSSMGIAGTRPVLELPACLQMELRCLQPCLQAQGSPNSLSISDSSHRRALGSPLVQAQVLLELQGQSAVLVGPLRPCWAVRVKPGLASPQPHGKPL